MLKVPTTRFWFSSSLLSQAAIGRLRMIPLIHTPFDSSSNSAYDLTP
jgi:hypothetical protein